MKTEPWEIKIRCNGKLHKIGMGLNGQLYFLDHEKSFWKIDPFCSCGKFLANWQAKEASLLPLKVQPIMQEIVFATKKGNPLNPHITEKAALNKRLYAYKTQKALERVVHSIKTKIKLHRVLEVKYDFRDRDDTRSPSAISLFSNVIFIHNLPYDWLKNIYSKKIAVINDSLIIDLFYDTHNEEQYIKLLNITADDGNIHMEKRNFCEIIKENDGSLLIILKVKKIKLREPIKPLTFTGILCNGEHHAGGISPKGRFYFKNHSKGFVKTESSFQNLGGTICGCYKYFIMMKKESPEKKLYRYYDIKEAFPSPEQLFEIYIKKVIRQELGLSRSSHFRNNFLIEYDEDLSPSSSLSVLQITPYAETFFISHSLKDWYRNVYKKGLSRIMGYFVESVEYAPNGEIYANVFMSSVNRVNSPLYPTKVLVKGSPGNYWFVSV